MRETSISKGQRLRKNGNVLRENQHHGLFSSQTGFSAQAPQQREAEDASGRGGSGLAAVSQKLREGRDTGSAFALMPLKAEELSGNQ